MSLILFLVGIVLLYLGKIKFNEIDEEGPHVRAAGLVLMTPFVGAMLLSLMINLMNRASDEAAALVGLLEFVGWVAAIGIAYALLFRRSGIPNLNIQVKPLETLQQQQQQQPAQMPRPRIVDRRQNFPKVMSVAEAARYLNVTEQFIMEAINEGRLAAAKINQRYSISRTALDELVSSENGKADSGNQDGQQA